MPSKRSPKAKSLPNVIDVSAIKLLTTEDRNALPSLASSMRDKTPVRDRVAHVRLFFRAGAATWLLVAGSPDTKKMSRFDDDYICMGFATLDGESWEWGSISVRELENIRAGLGFLGGLRVERDAHFTPRTVGEACPHFR
jgi:hypothetical protein